MVISLSGGIGNQMFQYAYGYAAAQKSGETLKLDAFFFERDRNRKYELGKYRISSRDTGCCRGFLYYAGRKAARTVHKEAQWNRFLRIDYEEEWFSYREKKANTFLSVGCFQNLRYFADYAQEIRREFEYIGSLTEAERTLRERIRQEDSVALHVRRGDYLTPRFDGIYALLEREYYDRALAYLSADRADHVYIFSDDIAWCRDAFSDLQNAVFVDQMISSDQHTDLELMRNCKNFIIANSSFSWWAAWLSKREDKIMIAPKRWFRDEKTNQAVQNAILQEMALL